MKPVLGMVAFGLTALAVGLVWASEQEELQRQAERLQLEAQKADQEAATELQKRTDALAEQVRRIEKERTEKLRAMSAEEREKRALAIVDRVEDLEKMREALQRRLGEDHPQIDAITREMEVLQDEIREIELTFKKQPGEAGVKIDHLRAAAEHLQQAGMPELAQEVRKRAEELERERGEGIPPEALKQLQEQMRDVQTALSKLHAEVAELREQLQNKKE
jgi:hypothetical protein